MLRRLAIAIVCVAVTSFAPTARAEDKVTVAGTGSNQILLRALAKAFEAKNPGIRVEVPDSIGSGGGIKAAGDGTVELGRTARKLKEKEMAYGLEYLPFAKTPVVFMAHPGTPVKGITTAQSVAVFSGKLKNWKELGGPDAKLRVVIRPEGESTLVGLRADLPEWKDMVMTTEAKVTDSEPQNAALVAEVAGTIGFTSYDVATDAGLVVLELDGVPATDPKYPVQVESALVYKAERMTGAVKAFTDFLFSEEGGAVIRKLGSRPIPR